MNDLILYTTEDGRSQHSKGNRQGILDRSYRNEIDTNYRGFLGSSKSRTRQSFAEKVA